MNNVINIPLSGDEENDEKEFVFEEVKDDILNHLNEGYIAHCITADYSLGAGLAKILNARYGLHDALISEFGDIFCSRDALGRALLAKDTRIFSLVDKMDRHDNADYLFVEKALYDMKGQCEQNKIKQIIMPRIACGRDRLDWIVVSGIIKEIFEDTDIKITVYYK